MAMTWKEIKKAVEEAGVQDDDEISLIQCENKDGNHTFQKVRLGKTLKVAENVADKPEGYSGCAV
jgi:hypothetical protein